MKYFYPKVVILIGFAFCINALVHYIKMEKGANGCKTKSSKSGGAAPADGAAAPAEAAAAPAEEATEARTGATGEGTELLVGGILKDPKTCGVYVCQNTEGDALIHYCQKPAPFEMCTGDGVDTDAPFPDCCWKCVEYVGCTNAPSQGQGGQGEQTK